MWKRCQTVAHRIWNGPMRLSCFMANGLNERIVLFLVRLCIPRIRVCRMIGYLLWFSRAHLACIKQRTCAESRNLNPFRSGMLFTMVIQWNTVCKYKQHNFGLERIPMSARVGPRIPNALEGSLTQIFRARVLYFHFSWPVALCEQIVTWMVRQRIARKRV